MHFNIRDHLEFSAKGRAFCPSCERKKGRPSRKKSCSGKDLTVLSIEGGMALVKAERWINAHEIEVRYLRVQRIRV